MLQEIERLLLLQNQDQQIRELQRLLKKLPQEVTNAQERLEEDKSNVSKIKKEIQENEITIKKLELDIQTRQDTIGKLKKQQYETRKNEEYQALGHEVTRYQGEITGLEDKELELMEKGEQLKQALSQAEKKRQQTQSLVDDELQQLEKKKHHAEEKLAEHQDERAVLSQRIDASILVHYDRLLQNKGDTAVVALSQGICSGCHIKVTTSTILSVKAEKDITQCEQCGRMLYLA